MDYRAIIKSRGLKQTWIAKQLEITDAMLSMFMSGKTNMDQVKIHKLNKILKLGDV